MQQVWPQVVEYMAKKKIASTIWAQVRAGFHCSGSPGSISRSPHATIRLYDSASKHVGGIHAPESPDESATFKGGMEKRSYHGEQRVKEDFVFTVNV
ncbi:hypothetical protein AGABI1DRAFT_133786 [Agaricus bisporus var. burnettii JB137-S8]|uniref:Uncharacterized protein n=1 Tax=Agaricus bisporus var. burnettii (strain JB137-S8 / ATCC MYA-4627 / FGSC 10392) TaxID=597362 RepID=K5WTA5_AGABU|nr:uncharacterized protein AGABI1DRAFT_133786 [Agaricus bisporus var. burnettii JB137-S8]EKM73983.1 hypothetical protein AGABI1DRAFT_133786 [Agaricus bisporus var. burnettii JB137-S8]